MKFNIRYIVIAFSLFVFVNCLAKANNTTIDNDFLREMKHAHVPVVGYALIKNYRIITVNTLSLNPKIKVSKYSLFQAASISKSISAYGALKLVSEGKLYLDTAVNKQLVTWKIPTNQYNKNHPVTLRQLLDMTSGLSVSGFPGYPQRQPLPTLNELLDGKPPATTPSIRVFYSPGTRYFYSGGGFEVLEKLLEDTTQQPFNIWIKNNILTPLKMHQTVYDLPSTTKKSMTNIIPGFLADGTMIKDGWENYPIASAGGLWSTPEDLAKFAIAVSNAYRGIKPAVISQATAKKMLFRQQNTDYGLGVVVNGYDETLNFRKSGHNLGYHSQLLMFPNRGDGIVIMTNSENGEALIKNIIPRIAAKYHWPCYFYDFNEMIVIPAKAC
jgi:CubicO group peptidase (beta-lactamase class C family)